MRNPRGRHGVYWLPAGGTDNQTPHREEEFYYVVSGRAHFATGSGDVPVKAGDILFVPANEPHHFFDVQESLELFVFFAPAEGTL